MSVDDVPACTLQERLHRLESVTDSDLAQLDVTELLTALLDRVRTLLDVDTAAVLLLAPAGDHLVATAALGIDEEVQQGVRVPLGKGFAGRIAAERSPVVLSDVNHTTVHNPLLVERGINALLGVPLLVGDDLLGVLHVGTLQPRSFTDDDTRLLQLVGDRIALTTQVSLSRAERRASRVLQRSLLPTKLPRLPGIEFAARYVPGDGEVGGDWYDVFAVPDGRLCLIIGDVAGSGLAAAVTMGRLRTVFRAHALDIADPADLLAKVDRHIQHFEPATMTTVMCGSLDPDTSILQLSAAGHPAPALAAPGAATHFPDLPRDLPLGINAERERHTTALHLERGSSVCFFTDGLVERRGECIDVGLDTVRRTVRPAGAETVCSTVMARLVGRASTHDDIAILTVATMTDHGSGQVADGHVDGARSTS